MDHDKVAVHKNPKKKKEQGISSSHPAIHYQQHQKIIDIILSLLQAVFFLCRIKAGNPNLARIRFSIANNIQKLWTLC